MTSLPSRFAHSAASLVNDATDSAPTVTTTPDSLEIRISGMSCGHCVTTVRKALESLPGVSVQRVVVGFATVELDADGPSSETIIEAIGGAGYQASIATGSEFPGKKTLPQAPVADSCCTTH